MTRSPVRVIEYQVSSPGGEPTGEIVALIATVADPGIALAEEPVALYPRLWESETIYASLSTVHPEARPMLAGDRFHRVVDAGFAAGHV